MKLSPKPKISVIMSVYNGMPFLREAVESILNQTYKNFEFIIVDDASTDETLNYLKNLKDKRIILIQNRRNLGLAESLNAALKKSKGDFIARMDADDISSPQRFKKQVKFLLRNPSLELCGTWVKLIDNQGQIIGEKKYPTENKEIKKALKWYSPIIHPTFMSRKKFYEKLNGYNKDFDFAEDYELLLRGRNKSKMANIGEFLLKWRLGDRRRSIAQMKKMDQVDLKIKIEAFRRGDFEFLYFFIILKKFLLTYFLPIQIKIKLAKILKLA